ncbi:MAG: universal stress protein [Gammaproteobacteria bacterium]
MSQSRESPVLVVMDPADGEGFALSRARRLAAALGSPLELFACEFDQAMEGSHFRITERLEAARTARVEARRQWLESVAGPLRAEGLEVRTEAVYANPRHEAVARRATETGAAFVVMRTHFHEWLTRATLSAADWQLIRICPAPLMLVKGAPWPEAPRLLAAVDPSHRDDRHAQLDHTIMDLAEQLDTALNAKTWVAHCIFSMASLESTAALSMMPDALGSSPEDYAGDLVQQLRAAVLRLLEGRKVPASRMRIVEGRPEKELPRLVEELEIDLLITGGISRSRIEQVFIGGTAERLLDRIGCDLLVVKPLGFRCPLA